MVLHITGQRIRLGRVYRLRPDHRGRGGVPGPDAVLALGTDRLPAAGLSQAKAWCLTELARRRAAGLIDLA